MTRPELAYSQVLWFDGISAGICPKCHVVVLKRSWDDHHEWHSKTEQNAPYRQISNE